MRTLCMSLFAACVLGTTPADTAPQGFEHWATGELRQMGHTLSEQAATDPRRFAVRQLADLPNDAFLLCHRGADGQAEWHETQADVFFVQSGSATLVVGGTMPNEETVAPHEKRGPSIQGGVRRKLSAGDVVRIPARTPHQLLLENGSRELNYFVIKVKGY
jgi:mannose-6-phosphate isomerase-like protein (cupin superfamily)